MSLVRILEKIDRIIAASHCSQENFSLRPQYGKPFTEWVGYLTKFKFTIAYSLITTEQIFVALIPYHTTGLL